MEQKTLLIIGGIIAAVIILALIVMGAQSTLVAKDMTVENTKAYVQSAYQRRADLIPNLVATVQGSATFEKSTLVELTAMRSQAGMVQQKMRQAQSLEEMQSIDQESIGGVLSRLMVVVENYPQIQSTQSFRDLQSQIEGTENRINYERNNYNDAVKDYKQTVRSMPMSFFAGFFGFNADKWQMFEATQAAQSAPQVAFTFT